MLGSRIVGIELEATLVPTVKSPFPVNGPVVVQNFAATATPAIVQIYPPPTYTNSGGRAAIFVR